MRDVPLSRLYRESALFKTLCDANNLEGKCGRCEYKQICGGSRSRAYAVTENVFAEEPCCSYQPHSQNDRELYAHYH
ncbi:MAG TPA: hypothetical protein VMU24_04265 [Candidatus Acidoferrales bacterium]|nr:hypothetical protein [Candidatus Acidoferrales bacterium]